MLLASAQLKNIQPLYLFLIFLYLLCQFAQFIKRQSFHQFNHVGQCIVIQFIRAYLKGAGLFLLRLNPIKLLRVQFKIRQIFLNEIVVWWTSRLWKDYRQPFGLNRLQLRLCTNSLCRRHETLL